MKTEYKIIADHLRSSCFLIADGALPSNEGRGYVLRRIMRRAMLQLHKLGTKDAVMYKFVDALIEEMGSAFPELVRARMTIIETLKNEEEKFRETLEKGLKILEEEVAKLYTDYPEISDETNQDGVLTKEFTESIQKSATKRFENIYSGKIKLPGTIAFKLYDTYGFPLDLTETILREKNISVDIDGFNKEMEQQRERAKASWKGSGVDSQNSDLLKLKEEIGGTEFVGYENLLCKAKIICLLVDGKKTQEISASNNEKDVVIILNKTPFYATSGGQKGDDGFLENDAGKIEISTTQKVENLFIHAASKITGTFKIGDEILAQVCQKTRKMRACNHSATHLMHKALKLILGDSISQKGSNVDAQYFTFDFNFNRAMTVQEITKVEDLVNNYIAQNSKVETKIMSIEKARESGAEALFGEKYDDQVRVVSMSPSIELCGGTHVLSTGEIGFFKIISEKSTASGIRRIEAKTNIEAKNFVQNELNNLENEFEQKAQKIAELENKKYEKALKSNVQNDFNYAKIKEEIAKLQQEIAAQDSQIKALNKQQEQAKKQNLLKNLDNFSSQNIGEIKLIHHFFQDLDAKDLREIAMSVKSKKDYQESCIFAFFASNQDKISALIAVCDNLLEKFDAGVLIKDVVAEIGGKGGGGKKDLAMGGGTNKDGVENAIEAVKKAIENS